MPDISVVIPHAGGRELITECLEALARSRNSSFETVIVDNGSVEPLVLADLPAQPQVQILHFKRKIGFAGACNRGGEHGSGDLLFFLNNDALVDPDTLAILAAFMNDHPSAAACQPKILSLQTPGLFDYSSAAGGAMDRYGFPFARGRVFDTIEPDTGQYDSPTPIFWGAGTALMIRRDLFLALGGFEEKFFAHMEEIDLQWRLQMEGWQIWACPAARVRHRGAATIKSGSFAKQYLNHRNNIAMLYRNYSPASLLQYLPIRIVLDAILLTVSFFGLNFKRLGAVVAAHFWCIWSLPFLVRSRRAIQSRRQIPDSELIKRLYSRSLVLDYFLYRRRTWTQLTALSDNYKTGYR